MAQRKLNFSDVLIVPQKSTVHSRAEVDLNVEFSFKFATQKMKCTPIMSANMDTVTNVETANILAEANWISVFPKHFNEGWLDGELPKVLAKNDNFSLSCGTSDQDTEQMIKVAKRIESTFGSPVKMITVDIANGYLDRLTSVCANLRQRLPDTVICAGNIVTPEGMYELVHNGLVDVVKVGIGSGAACTTRLKTGVGYPQFSAVSECQ